MSDHYYAETDADYYGLTTPPASYRCGCGRWFLTTKALADHCHEENT